jgi:hypothetical protein
MAPGARIAEALSAGDVAACRALFEEYWAAQAFSPCFQGFERELASLPGDYAPPRGCLMLALGYAGVLLDTMPTMDRAQALYGELGFVDTARYNDNLAPGVRFMRLDLARVTP